MNMALKKKLGYADQQMQDALRDVAVGMSVRAAAKLHGVPRITLLNKHKGKYPSVRKMGPPSILSKDEEGILVTWIESVSRVGFPVTKGQLLDSVQELLKTMNRPNSFSEGRPGKSWYKSFIKRNPLITSRLSENLTVSRANITKESLEKWFTEIHSFLENCQYDSILESPDRVFNCDESAFFLNPKGNRVLAIKGDKNVYQVVNSDEKECVTVLVAGSAAGQLPPPLIVFKYKRIPDDVGRSIPEDWGLGKSESGWMTGQVFFDYMVNVFHPWLLRENITLPVILFVDGHTSHLTLQTSQFCQENQIVLIALHPNATHIMQPLDVSVFRSLKAKWKQVVHQWRIEHSENPVLKKKDFAPLLRQALDMLTPDTIFNGFRKCGLCPWNPQEVLNPVKNQAEKDTRLSRIGSTEEECRIVLKVMKEQLSAQQLESFEHQSETYTGELEHKSLYTFWRNIRTIASQSSEVLSLDEAATPNQFHYENVDSPDPVITENNNDSMESPPVITENNNDSVGSPNSLNNYPTPSTSTNQPTIPSPFKKALNWNPLNYLQSKPGRNRGIGPGAVTSKQWQEECTKKMEKKQEAEENKKRRAEERIRKKEEREALKRRKNEEKEKRKQAKLNTKTKRRKVSVPVESSSEEEWQPSHELEDGSEGDENPNELMETDENERAKEEDECELEENNNYTENVDSQENMRCDTNNDQIVLEISSTEQDLHVPSICNPSPLDGTQSLPLCNISQDETLNGRSDLNKGKLEEPTPLFVVGFSSRKKNIKVLYKIVDNLTEDEFIVHLMKPCNRFRTVFAEDTLAVSIISVSDIVDSEMLQPLVYGNKDNRRYQFPKPIDVQR